MRKRLLFYVAVQHKPEGIASFRNTRCRPIQSKNRTTNRMIKGHVFGHGTLRLGHWSE
jgi:hypothetical protein